MSIDEFLDAAFDELAGRGPSGRRALIEAEEHLRSAAAAEVRAGSTTVQAEEVAVARFGDPVDFARGVARAHAPTGLPALISGIWALGASLAIGAGIAGAVAEVLGDTLGPMFVSGDRYGVTYAAWRCAEYLRYAPHGSSCAAAAALDHWGEVVEGRIGLGVLGLLALIALAVARRTTLRSPKWRVPRPAVGALGTTLFIVVAVVRGLPDGLTALWSTTTGTGAGLADGATSVVCAAVLLVVAFRGRRVLLRSVSSGA